MDKSQELLMFVLLKTFLKIIFSEHIFYIFIILLFLIETKIFYFSYIQQIFLINPYLFCNQKTYFFIRLIYVRNFYLVKLNKFYIACQMISFLIFFIYSLVFFFRFFFWSLIFFQKLNVESRPLYVSNNFDAA